MPTGTTVVNNPNARDQVFRMKPDGSVKRMAANEVLLRARVPRAQTLAGRLTAFRPSRVTPFVII